MKRGAALILAVGLISAVVVAVLHAFGAIAPLEAMAARAVANADPVHRLPESLQYLFIALVAFFVAWLTIGSNRSRAGLLVALLIAEIVALALICGFYQALFPPVPSALAAVASYPLALGAMTLPLTARRRTKGISLAERMSESDFNRMRSGDLDFNRDPRFADVTAVVCDLSNKYELAETLEPVAVARASQNFTSRAREILLQAGAYLHAADGEGVVALFGFHYNDKEHAKKAISAAFDLTRALASSGKSDNGESANDVHVGISSGQLISSPGAKKDEVFIMGEPIELARRFAVANRLYGSRILIGPRTFEMASDRFIARPIDFLGGINSHERHEIYEPLAIASDAPRDLIERRDCFWNGVVLYREKRWGEAYAQFQKARGPAEVDDEPLNIYLRRLEPLALHLVDGDN